MKPREGHQEAYDALQSWKFISVIGILGLGIIASIVSSYVAERRDQEKRNWPSTKGVPIDTRIVKDPPTQRFTMTMYHGECSVRYVVAGKTYSVWTGADYMDPDRNFVAERMGECPIRCFVVHYNPVDATDAIARNCDAD